MILKKGLTKDLLIFLAVLVDNLDAYSFKNQMRRICCDGWYRRSSVSPTVNRLLTVGEIEKIEKKGKVYYQLTSKGSNRIKENIPLLRLANKSWDKRWRIVIFDIAEKKRYLREALRDKLVSLGFGKWQRSVYITPHDIEQEINQYLQTRNLLPSCACLVARRSDLGNDKTLANKVWQLEKLNEEYQEFIDDCHETIARKKVKDKELKKLWLTYKEIILKDPFLPKVLLPKGWLAVQAKREFIKLCQTLG